jgi:hypothetical protein
MRKTTALSTLHRWLLATLLLLGVLGYVGIAATAAAGGLAAGGSRVSSSVQVSTSESSKTSLTTQSHICVSQGSPAHLHCIGHKRSTSFGWLSRLSAMETVSWTTGASVSVSSWGTFSLRQCANGACSTIDQSFLP